MSSRPELVAAAILILSLSSCGEAPEVEVVAVRRGRIVESFREPARTRLPREHVVTMPVAGRVERLSIEPGQPVRAGEELARVDRVPLEAEAAAARAEVQRLEAQVAVLRHDRAARTALAEARRRVEAASGALAAAEAQLSARQAETARARAEQARLEALFAKRSVSQRELDDVRLAATTAAQAEAAQRSQRAAAAAQLALARLGPAREEERLARLGLEAEVLERQAEGARARLRDAEHRLGLAQVLSPIDGVVFERLEDGGRELAAGAPLARVGDLAALEVVADVLTGDAMRLTTGGIVELEASALDAPVPGVVTRIEPSAFTKLSSLGVEQQRVRVVVALRASVPGLGEGYRLAARFLTGAKDDALVVPRAAVFEDPDGSSHAFVVEGGKLTKVAVTLGLGSDFELEVTAGLAAGQKVVAAASNELSDGAEARAVERK